MSPYMQNVVNAQQREARRAGEIQRNQNQAQAVNAGAFGGSRQAIMEAERQRNMATQLGDIQAQGLQQAYGQGMGQFNAEQNAYLQAQQANQNANLQAGIQNLQAQQAAQAAQEASRQFGANLGLQGYGQSLQAAQTLGSLGNQQYQQDMGTIQAMAGMGAQEQAQTQNIINQAMQNYATQQQYPLMQLGVMSNMLRGLPMQASTTQNYQAQPSLLSQGAGVLGTGLGLYQQGQKAGIFKQGGVVKMASGGIATGMSAGELGAKLKGPSFTDAVLQQKANDPQTDQATKDLVAAEIARRANLRAGMANGGIIAFRKGSKKAVKESTEQKAEDITLPEADVGGEGILKALEKSPTTTVPEGPEPEKQPARDYTGSIRQSYAGAQPKEEAMAMPVDNEGIIAAARKNVSPVPMASAPAPSAGVTTAPSGPSYRDVEAANLEAGLSASGIKPTQRTNPLAELEATTNEEMLRQKALRDESKGDKIKRFEQERKDAGVPDLFQVEKDKLTARKLRGEASEKETAQNNLIRFLTKWGTIPGSAIRGMVGAGAELVDKMDLDEKHKQKFLNELDDIDSRINNAEYSRRIGDEGRAREEQQKAGELYFKLGHDLRTAKVNYAIKEMDATSKYEIAQLKADIATAKGASKAAIIQMADKLFEGYIAEGKPANAITYNQAVKDASKMLPGVQAAEIGLGPKITSAGADVTRATTGEKDAENRAKEEARKRMKDAKDAADDETSSKTFRDQLKGIYKEEGAKTSAEKAAIRRREEKRVLDDKKIEYDVAPVKPAAAAPAAAKPVAKFNPTTGKWEQ